MKRVGVDFHVFDGIFQGSRSHILEIFSRVVSIYPEVRFYFFLEKTEELKQSSPAFSLPNVALVAIPHVNSIKRLCIILPKMQRKYNLDLLHTQYISPLPSYSKTVITLHDILFESHPKFFSMVFKLRSKVLMRLSAVRSEHIFTVSEFSKTEISERYGIEGKNISVIYNGVDQDKFYPGTSGKQPIIDRGLVPGEYILTVGRLEPRKNHELLIRAYARLKTSLPLVLVGQKHFGYHHIEKTIAEFGLSERVQLIQDVGDGELPSFYRHARVFVYPTWAEGFGMPVIEAMASGVPVITSNTTSIPEVVGCGGILIDPSSVDEVTDALYQVLKGDALSEALAKYGIKRAKLYDWNAAAQRVKDVYQQILENDGNKTVG